MAFSGPSWPTEMCFIFSYQRFSPVDLRMDASVSANCCPNGNFGNVINLPYRRVLRTYFAVCSVCRWIISSSLLFLAGEFLNGETTVEWMQKLPQWQELGDALVFGSKWIVHTQRRGSPQHFSPAARRNTKWPVITSKTLTHDLCRLEDIGFTAQLLSI